MSTHPADPSSQGTLERWHRENTYLQRLWDALKQRAT